VRQVREVPQPRTDACEAGEMNFSWRGMRFSLDDYCAVVYTENAMEKGKGETEMYVETDCVFEVEGHKYEADGAVVTPDRIVAYPGENGRLNDWHGNPIGTYRIVSTWRTPRSYVSSTMHQIEATVNGIVYTGRGAGTGMIYTGKRKR
jgi:hypothetical protein